MIKRQVIVVKTYCFKLYKAKRNKKLHKVINIAGIIYNHCIVLHKRYYRLFKKSLNIYKLQKHLTKLKKIGKFSYFKEVGSQAIQDITQRIDRAYKLFFRNLKHKIRTAPPSFKKIRKYKSFTLKQAGWKLLKGNIIEINKQKYKYFKSRDIEGIVKTITIKRDTLGDIYLYFVCETNENKVLARTGKSVGYDFGLKQFLTASDNEDIKAPLFFKQNANDIKKANRILSRKKKTSNHRRLAKIALARLHKKISNQRKDFHFKLANKICSEYALICIEDLNIKGMQKRWGRKISDYGFSEFIKILEYKAREIGSIVQKIDRYYPSSQICHVCGTKNPETKNLAVREWICAKCKTSHDRDRNAAINIWKVGASTFFGEI